MNLLSENLGNIGDLVCTLVDEFLTLTVDSITNLKTFSNQNNHSYFSPGYCAIELLLLLNLVLFSK